MVDGGDQRRADVAQQPVPERLVVVHHVEVPAPGAQMAAGAQGEGQRFGEAAGPHRADLDRVDPVAELLALGGAEGVRLAVQVEAGQFRETEVLGQLGEVLVQHGVRLGSDDLDPVAEAGQFA